MRRPRHSRHKDIEGVVGHEEVPIAFGTKYVKSLLRLRLLTLILRQKGVCKPSRKPKQAGLIQIHVHDTPRHDT